MPKLFKPWLWLTGVLTIALVAGFACGDDDDDDTDTPAATTAAASATGGEEETPTEASGEVLTDVGVSDTEIKLGQHIVQSGNRASAFAPVAPTLQAYFKYINEEEGGVCGRQIVLIQEDDQYAPPLALEKAKKLAEQDKVAAFIGNLGTPPNQGSVAYINEQEIPDLFIATGVNSFADTETYPWTVLFNPDYESEGTILANYVNDNFADQTVAILSQNDDFGAAGRDSFEAAFAGSVVATETYDATATDINSQLANMRAANPDIVYLYSTPSYTASAYAYMRTNQWTPQVVMSYVNSATTLASLVGETNVPEGFNRIQGAISNNYVLDAVADADDPNIVEHTRIMGEYGGPAVGTLTVYAQAIAETTVQTLETACENGDLTRAGILAAAEELDGFHPTVLLPGIDITVSATDHSAIQSLVPVKIEADGTLTALVEEPLEGGG